MPTKSLRAMLLGASSIKRPAGPEIESSSHVETGSSTVPAWERIVSKLAADSPKAHRIVLALLAILTLESAVAILSAGCPILNSMVWDVSTALDGGYRVALGQRPHVDFYSPHGALFLLLVAGGSKMAGLASAFASVHALMLIVLVAWTWALLRSRTSAALAGIVSFWVGVLAVTPRSLGFPAPMITYSMQYNRWGWALLAIACIELFLLRRDGVVRMGSGASTGVIAGLLLFLKPNYFAAVVAAILVRSLVSKLNWRWAAGLAGGFLGVAAAGFWYLQFNFGAYIGDMRLVASVQSLSGRIANIVQLTAANIPDLWFLGSSLLIVITVARRVDAPSTSVLRIAAPPLAVAAIGIGTCGGNYQILQIPLIYLSIFLLMEYSRRVSVDYRRWGGAAFLIVFLSGAGATAKPFFDDIATLIAARADDADPQIRDWPRLEAPGVAGLRIEARPRTIPTEAVRGGLRAGATTWREQNGEAYPYVLWFNAGAALLKDRLSSRPRVLVMDLSNPFSFALGLTPPTGDALFWHYGRDFDERHFPAPSRVFHTVTDVMIPKTPIHATATKALQRIYAPVLQRDFQKAAENDLWVRYERRP